MADKPNPAPEQKTVPDQKPVTPAAEAPKPDAKAEAKPAAPAEKPKKVDSEALSQFTARWLGDKPPKDAEKKDKKDDKDKEKPAAKEKEKEGEGDDKAAKPKPPTPKATPKTTTAPDYDKIAAAAAEGATRALAAIQKDDQKDRQATNEPKQRELPEAERRKIETLKLMEKRNPEKYKGISDKYRNAIVAGLDYADQWEKENPGETFADDDPEHEEFFAKNNVNWDDDDFLDARAEMLLEPKVKEATKEVSQRLEQFEAKEKERELAPKIDRHQAFTAKSFFTSVGSDMAGMINEDGTFNKELYDKLSAEDAIRVDIAIANAQNFVEPVAGEIMKLYEGVTKLDLKRQDHQFINNLAVEAERGIMSLPEEQRMNDRGEIFATAAEYNRMNAEQRRKHWTLSAKDLSDIVASEAAQRTKSQIENEVKKVQRWTKSKSLLSGTRTETPGRMAEQNPQPDDDKPTSPTITGEPKLAREAAATNLDAGKPLNTFTSRFLGQR